MTLNISRKLKHKNNGRCSECKNSIFEMCRVIFGKIKLEHKFDIPLEINEYRDLKCFKPLNKVYSSLVEHRGYKEFVRGKKLSPCDIYIPKIDCIVELDEQQHFSLARN